MHAFIIVSIRGLPSLSGVNHTSPLCWRCAGKTLLR